MTLSVLQWVKKQHHTGGDNDHDRQGLHGDPHSAKVTELGRASANISKGHGSHKWYVIGFAVRTSDNNSYRNVFGEIISDTMHEPVDLGWANTLWEAKLEAERFINRTVCMRNLHDEIMVDAT